jgi:hypothetical protein
MTVIPVPRLTHPLQWKLVGRNLTASLNKV